MELALFVFGGLAAASLAAWGTWRRIERIRGDETSKIESPGGRRCPVCGDALTARAGELLEDRCPTCRGHFLPAALAQEVVYAPRNISPGDVKDAATGKGLAKKCPDCGAQMRPVLVDEDIVDACASCGAVWCDAGELPRVSAGRARG